MAAAVGGTVLAWANFFFNDSAASDLFLGWLGVSGFASGLLLTIRIVHPAPLHSLVAHIWPSKPLFVLTLFLVFMFTSRLFLGFWHPGIGGWGYEDTDPPGVPANEADLSRYSSLTGPLNLQHRAVLEGSVSGTLRVGMEPRCWEQEALVVESTTSGNSAGDVENQPIVRLATGESFGWVFPGYLSHDLALSAQTLDLLWNPGEVSPIHGLIMERANWASWRYPSHTPTVGGFVHHPGESVVGLYQYASLLCNDRSGEIRVQGVKLLGAYGAH